MSTMINNLKTPYYYCLNTNSPYMGVTFYIGWEYPKNHIDKILNINESNLIDETNFKLVK